LNGAEAEFLARVAQGFGVEPDFAPRAGRGAMPQPGEDPYATLGISRNATNEEIRARWKTLMRENHPDSLASRGVPPAMIAAASDRVARINAAYDAVKRERRL
jgi:DnaJ like chaperone protein